MGDVVNLNRFRKRKAREAAAKVAAANRVKFGRTRAEKAQQSNQRELEVSRHDGHELVNDLEPHDDHAPDDHAPDDHAPDDHAPDDHAPDDHASDDHALDDGGIVPEPVGADDSES